jgi:hypothetical protein
VIIVTPYLVRPVSGQLALPTDGYPRADDVQQNFEGQTSRRFNRKDATMRSKSSSCLLARRRTRGCNHRATTCPTRPRARSTCRSCRAPIMCSTLGSRRLAAPGEAARLDAWFRGPRLGYGDAIYVDGGPMRTRRDDVAQIAGRYGMLVSARRAGHRRRVPRARSG